MPIYFGNYVQNYLFLLYKKRQNFFVIHKQQILFLAFFIKMYTLHLPPIGRSNWQDSKTKTNVFINHLWFGRRTEMADPFFIQLPPI